MKTVKECCPLCLFTMSLPCFDSTDPVGVMNFAAPSLEQTSITVSWNVPDGEYDGFVVLVTSPLDEDYAPSLEWESFISDSTFTLSDLQPSTEYTITVVSILNATDEFEEQRSQIGGGMAIETTGWCTCLVLSMLRVKHLTLLAWVGRALIGGLYYQYLMHHAVSHENYIVC